MGERASMRIMLLEDEPLIAMTTEQMLEELGYERIDVFYRLDPAVEAAEAGRYDAAILDVNVDRQQTSLDLARKMHADGTAIIFASGNTIDREEIEALACATIGKPYTKDDIRVAIEAI